MVCGEGRGGEGAGGGSLSYYRYRSSRLPGAMAIDCIESGAHCASVVSCTCGIRDLFVCIYVCMNEYLEAPVCLCFICSLKK